MSLRFIKHIGTPSSAYQELVKAVSSLASFGIIHADMRPENIVISCSHPRQAVLIDFGDQRGREGAPALFEEFGHLAPGIVRVMLEGKHSIVHS
ncbi:hypothetical protein BDR03DRAFT_960103 [Suillus americanus]|nr:hypothetical protein BDR03DRAFT_960103 [Suillus americanus]